MGRSCDYEVSEHHFQTINCKHKYIKAEIFKTHKKYLRTINKFSRLEY